MHFKCTAKFDSPHPLVRGSDDPIECFAVVAVRDCARCRSSREWRKRPASDQTPLMRWKAAGSPTQDFSNLMLVAEDCDPPPLILTSQAPWAGCVCLLDLQPFLPIQRPPGRGFPRGHSEKACTWRPYLRLLINFSCERRCASRRPMSLRLARGQWQQGFARLSSSFYASENAST